MAVEEDQGIEAIFIEKEMGMVIKDTSHIILIFYFKLKMPVGREGIPLHSVK